MDSKETETMRRSRIYENAIACLLTEGQTTRLWSYAPLVNAKHRLLGA